MKPVWFIFTNAPPLRLMSICLMTLMHTQMKIGHETLFYPIICNNNLTHAAGSLLYVCYMVEWNLGLYHKISYMINHEGNVCLQSDFSHLHNNMRKSWLIVAQHNIYNGSHKCFVLRSWKPFFSMYTYHKKYLRYFHFIVTHF